MQTQPAAFSIKNYRFDKVHIDLDQHTNNELQLDFETSGTFFAETHEYALRFVVKTQGETAKSPFAEIQCTGVFTFSNITGFDDIPEFFYRNSIAILFPYVRAYLSLVTTQANVPGIILPTLNLSNLEGQLRENTSQK